MARTPIMRSLKWLATEARFAEKSGLPLEEVRERQALAREGGLTRRKFLAGGAALAAGAFIPYGIASARPSGGGSAPRIVIIGGGISGLACALTLDDSGLSSTIYEALESVGGRMRSDTPAKPGCGSCHDVGRPVSATWADGQFTDVFGEFIDSSHATMLGLAGRFGLPLTDLLAAEPPGSTPTYFFHGSYYPKAQADEDYQAIVPLLKKDLRDARYPTLYDKSTAAGRALDNMSVYDWIETRVPGGHSVPLGMLLDVAYNIEYGAETADQSALNLLYLLGYDKDTRDFDEFGASDEQYRIAGGNEQLPRAIGQYLGSRCPINTEWALESIAKRSDGRYDLSFGGTFSNGGRKSDVADIVILAMPFSSLRTIDYGRAGFDSLKKKAIQELGAGHNGKLHVQLTSRPWKQSGPPGGVGNGLSYADTGYQNTWESTRGQLGPSGILVQYTGGNGADGMNLDHPYGNTSDRQVIADARRFLSQVEPVFPGISALWNGRAAGAVPFLNPFWNCSYAYWRRGQYQTIAGYERVAQGSVFFCGEHTSIDFQGFMEGGASEGVSAGKAVALLLGRGK